MIAPQEIPVMPADIKCAIDEQGRGNADLMENSEQVQDDQDSVNQEPQKVEEEQGQANIEDFDQVSKKIEHPVDSNVMSLPKNPIGTSEIKSIVQRFHKIIKLLTSLTLTSSSGIDNGSLKIALYMEDSTVAVTHGKNAHSS